MKNKITLSLASGKTRKVNSLGEFNYVIDGQTFRLAVHTNPDDVYQSVTDIASGLRVCGVGVTAEYLPAYHKAHTPVERARLSVDALIKSRGAARVRSVIASAPALVQS